MKRIVVGIDGSEESRRALHEAARLAEALGTRLEVVMAWQHSTSMYDAYYPEPGRGPRHVRPRTPSGRSSHGGGR